MSQKQEIAPNSFNTKKYPDPVRHTIKPSAAVELFVGLRAFKQAGVQPSVLARYQGPADKGTKKST